MRNNDLRKKIEDYSYSMNDLLHEGVNSKVYKGSKENTREPVAIKVINIQSFKSKEDKKALECEIEAIKKLSHPNLLKCLDVYSTVNNCYIITEYCEGGTLKGLLLKKKNKLKEQDIANIFRDVYKGYKHLYSKGLAHRNIDPSNILIKNGEYKLGDFGMTSNETNYEIKGAGGPLLKSPYHNPEDLKAGVLKPKCDIYSLGVVLYELFHKRLPFESSRNKVPVFDDIPLNAKDLIRRSLALDGYAPLTIEEFSAHSYITHILYNNSTAVNPVFKQDFKSIPLTKVYSSIQNRPTAFQLDRIKESNKMKVEHAITGQLNFVKFLFKLYEMIPKSDLQFVVIKHLLSIVQSLNQSIKLSNPYESECIVNFFSSSKSSMVQESIRESSKRYEHLSQTLNTYISKGSKNKALQLYLNKNLDRSQGFIISSISIILSFIKSTFEELKLSKQIRMIKDQDDLLEGEHLSKALALDFAITYYQLNSLSLNNWNDLNHFYEQSRIGDIVQIEPSSLTKASLKDIENKIRALEIL